MAGRSESMYLEKCRNKGRKNMKKKILTDVNFLHIIIKTFFETVFLNVSVIESKIKVLGLKTNILMFRSNPEGIERVVTTNGGKYSYSKQGFKHGSSNFQIYSKTFILWNSFFVVLQGF